jgi:hypothetical protein
MALTSKWRNKAIDAIHVTMAKIGVTNSTAMPASKNNREPIAWEFYVATEMRKTAVARREQAVDAIKSAGIIPAHLAKPDRGYPKEECWRGEHIAITCEVRAKRGGLDVDQFVANLKAAGVDMRLIGIAYEAAVKPISLQALYEAVPIIVD